VKHKQRKTFHQKKLYNTFQRNVYKKSKTILTLKPHLAITRIMWSHLISTCCEVCMSGQIRHWNIFETFLKHFWNSSETCLKHCCQRFSKRFTYTCFSNNFLDPDIVQQNVSFHWRHSRFHLAQSLDCLWIFSCINASIHFRQNVPHNILMHKRIDPLSSKRAP